MGYVIVIQRKNDRKKKQIKVIRKYLLGTKYTDQRNKSVYYLFITCVVIYSSIVLREKMIRRIGDTVKYCIN